MKRVAYLCTILAVTACGPNDHEDDQGTDQCLRNAIFAQCMAALPKGPEHLTASGNDWAEVVSECDDAARAQSYRTQRVIKPECRSWGAPAGKAAP